MKARAICRKVTSSGQPCKNHARASSEYCWLHSLAVPGETSRTELLVAMIGVAIAAYMIIPGTVSGIADMLSIIDRSWPRPNDLITTTPLLTIGSTESVRILDPWDYCMYIGTIDRPDDRYIGDRVPYPLMSQLILTKMLIPGYHAVEGIAWRCDNGQLKVCIVENSDYCGPAHPNISPPNEMIEYCKEHPDEEWFPGYIQGHGTTLIQWSCKDGVVVIAQNSAASDSLDARGFLIDEWTSIPRPSSNDGQSAP